MPVVFDIVGLVNNVREPISDDGDELEDNPFFTDEENPLLRMDSIGQLEEIDEEDTEVTDGEEEDGETEGRLEDRVFLMAWNVRPITIKNLNEEIVSSYEEIEDELKIELSKSTPTVYGLEAL